MSQPRTHAALIVFSNTAKYRIECLEQAIDNIEKYTNSTGVCSDKTFPNIENTLCTLSEMLDIEIAAHEEFTVELDLMKAIAAFMTKRRTFETKDMNHYVNEAARLCSQNPIEKNVTYTHDEDIMSST
jgi:hypothetical protein